jgi:PAS domain-containing protein
MILRLLRGLVRAGQEVNLQQFIRDEAVAHALQIPGLMSVQPATRTTPDGLELVLLSTWNGFDDVTAFGGDLDTMVVTPGAQSMLTRSRAEHYELVIGEARTMPLHTAKLRLTRIPIRPNAEAAYYQAVRRWSDRLLDDSGMVAFMLGRRVNGRQDEIVAAQVFVDESALQEIVGPDVERPMGRDELSPFWAAEPVIEHFDALTAAEPSPDAPAILVVDDQRRYVHATPAAARLSGRSVARLLTMRVEDITPEADRAAVSAAWERFVADGSMRGPYVLHRPDGSEVAVNFSAKANTPWPGSHASLIVPSDDDSELDVDRALVDAGLVARYAPAAS